MKRKKLLILSLALSGFFTATSVAFAKAVCDYGAGQTLLTGPITSSTFISNGNQVGFDGKYCYGTTVTTQPFACLTEDGYTASSGTLTVSTPAQVGPCGPDPI